jgi:hypothetical protein
MGRFRAIPTSKTLQSRKEWDAGGTKAQTTQKGPTVVQGIFHETLETFFIAGKFFIKTGNKHGDLENQLPHVKVTAGKLQP